MNMKTTPACMVCSHLRCHNCTQEVHEISGRTSPTDGGEVHRRRFHHFFVPESRLEKRKPVTGSDDNQASSSSIQKEDESTVQRRTVSPASDADTLYSTTSSTTAVDDVAVASISQRLTIFHELGQLWPQLILRCGSRDMAMNTIRKLLRWCAQDLESLANQQAGPERKLCQSTSRFIRKKQSKIASKILQEHSRTEDHLDADKPLNDHEDQNDDDDHLNTFSVTQEDLFDQVIQNLQGRIKTVLRLDCSPKEGLVTRPYRSAEVYVMNIISRLSEAPLRTGQKRLRWVCVSLPVPSFLLHLLSPLCLLVVCLADRHRINNFEVFGEEYERRVSTWVFTI